MIESVRLHLDNFCIRFSDLLELVLDGEYFLPVNATWSKKECEAFQNTYAAELTKLFGIDRKSAEMEVSWFIDRYGFRTE